MNKKIEFLTEEQQNKLTEYRDKWLKIGLSTELCDREKAKAAAIEAYKIAGLKPPTVFIWMNSPLEGAFAAAYLCALKKDDKNFSAQVRDQVGAQVGAYVVTRGEWEV